MPTPTPIQCETACTRLKRAMPYRWDMNIYRGCTHGCKYCYAQYTHGYLGEGDFARDIYVKTNIAEQLEKQMAAPGWTREVVNLGGVTDSYQPAEETQRLMPDILRLLIKHKTPAIISTKSDLVLRDFDLIDELSRITYVNVAASITTTDEALAKSLEPGAKSPARRFAMLKEMRKTNASTGLHFMPLIPLLCDSEESIDALYAAASNAGVQYVLPGTLYLRGKTKPLFMGWMQQHHPDLYPHFAALYKAGGADKGYKSELYEMVARLREKHGLNSSYAKIMREKMPPPEQEQLSFT